MSLTTNDQYLGHVAETANLSAEHRREWVLLNCPRGHFIGYTNHKAVIYGGTYFEMPSVNLHCKTCKQVKKYHFQTKKNIIRFVTEDEMREICGL